MSSSDVLPAAVATTHRILDDALNCGSGGGGDTFFGLRVAAVFIIMFTSTSGAMFPVLAKRSTWLNVPKGLFECVNRMKKPILDSSSSL